MDIHGIPLGVINKKCYAPKGKTSQKGRDNIPIKEKESYRWLESYRTTIDVAKRCRNTQIVSAKKLEDVTTDDLSNQKEGLKLTKEEKKRPENVKAVLMNNRSTKGILAVVGIVVLLFGLSIIKRRQNGE